MRKKVHDQEHESNDGHEGELVYDAAQWRQNQWRYDSDQYGEIKEDCMVAHALMLLEAYDHVHGSRTHV